MKKEDILEVSRKENKNKDLADLAISAEAGNVAGRVGACVCCLISVVFVCVKNTMLFSPWIIYFSILGTHYLVKFIKLKRKTDLTITVLYFAMCFLFFVLFVFRLIGVKA